MAPAPHKQRHQLTPTSPHLPHPSRPAGATLDNLAAAYAQDIFDEGDDYGDDFGDDLGLPEEEVGLPVADELPLVEDE